MSWFSNLFKGSKEKHKRISTLLPGQQGIYNQLQQAGQGEGAGGAFGQSADYYRGLLGNNQEDFDAFAAPQMRQYNQDIVPGLAEQFAGYGGSGGSLNSSGFRNAQMQGATDLSERLGALRAQLRQSGAQGLQNIGQAGLGNFSQDVVTQPGSQGLLSSLAPALGKAAGTAIGGPLGGAMGAGLGSWFQSKSPGNNTGANTAPSQAAASPRIGTPPPSMFDTVRGWGGQGF